MIVSERRAYNISPLLFNGIFYTEIIIDSHYEAKHNHQINDELILSLIALIGGSFEIADDTNGNYSYFVKKISFNKKTYRLIWVVEKNQYYVGVVNAFRDSAGEK